MRLDTALPIVNADGTMTDTFRGFLLKVDRYLPILGSGSPEGVVDAPLHSVYVDVTSTSAPIDYRKMQADIGGDTKQGWEAI